MFKRVTRGVTVDREVQWQTSVVINAPIADVWEAIADLSLIPSYHPVVKRVEYVSGETRRAPGVAYKCIIPEGRQRGWCVEKVVDCIPNQRMSVSIDGDSWGMSRMFEDFLAETVLEPSGAQATRVRLTAYYTPRGFRSRLLNLLVLRRMMRTRARQTIEGFKRLVECQS